MLKGTDQHVLQSGVLRAAHPFFLPLPNESSGARDHDHTGENRKPPGLEALSCQTSRCTAFDLEFSPLESYLTDKILIQTEMYMNMYSNVVYGIKMLEIS